MSLPTLPILAEYQTLSTYLGDVLTTDRVETRGVIASGLNLLGIGWAEFLTRRDLRTDEMIVSGFLSIVFLWLTV